MDKSKKVEISKQGSLLVKNNDIKGMTIFFNTSPHIDFDELQWIINSVDMLKLFMGRGFDPRSGKNGQGKEYPFFLKMCNLFTYPP